MSNLITLGEVKAEVERRSQSCWDDQIAVKDMTFDSLDTISINHECHTMRPMAQRSMAYRLGIPIQYLQKCDPELQATNLNHWLKQERNDNLFLRFDGNEVRAVFTPRYTPVDHLEVIESLEQHGYSLETPTQCRVDDELLVLSIPDDEKTYCLKGNDRMTPGISIVNSEVGLSSLTLSAYVLRLICTNGLISKTSVDSSYRHVSRRVLNEFPQALNQVANEMNRQQHQWTISLESPVADPETTLRSFNRQFQLDKPEAEAVEWAWPQEAGDRMFHVVNTYTKAAQHRDMNAEQSCHLQRTGGAILAMLN